MALYTRTVPEMHIKYTTYPQRMRLEFDDTPLKYDAAQAYLERTPGGTVIASRGRGPLHGFIHMLYIRSGERLPRWWREYYVVTRHIIHDEVEAQRTIEAALLTIQVLDKVRSRAFGRDI